MTDADGSPPDLVPRLAAFTRLLHDAGLEAGPGRLERSTEALGLIDLRDAASFRDTLRACLVSRKEELPIFEAAFDLFWAPPDPGTTAGMLPGKSRPLPMDPERAKAWIQALGLDQSPTPRPGEEEPTPSTSSGYSAQELLRQKDFEELTWQETEQVKQLLQQSPWRVAERRTRRLRPAKGGQVDLRRTVRNSIRSNGELIQLLHRRVRWRRRPIILLCDVSGSMEQYSRLLLIFAHAVARRENVETFVFSTRLTRITRLLRYRDLDRALEHVGKQVHDFSGGTRIGEALAEFNRRWARRVLGHGAIVIVISDGWDRGDPQLLEHELDRLRRMSHRLIWLNPLLGSEGYEPVTRGMAAALPHCDDFLSAHNVQALDQLGRLLDGLDRRRPVRSAPGRSSSRGDAEGVPSG
ncbi:MAG: VWA domain-containing protein [Candidatus Dormibacteraeota bacterium]|nr:VWA domain-containing protein [Candidatus Dormibacteraeota bacterium]MBO0759686.1 VWA domain-containing protein [Candidatus Dormibacteraeota bacterium]